jgi:hypothetical protein
MSVGTDGRRPAEVDYNQSVQTLIKLYPSIAYERKLNLKDGNIINVLMPMIDRIKKVDICNVDVEVTVYVGMGQFIITTNSADPEINRMIEACTKSSS